MLNNINRIHVATVLSVLMCALLVFGCAGCTVAGWEGPELEKQELGTQTIPNARQFAGYPAADGKRVKDGVLLRSGALYGASSADIEVLREEYGLRAVVDLRTTKEAAEQPDPVIEDVAYWHLPLMEEDGGAQNQAAVIDIYRLYADEPGLAYVEMVRAGALSDAMYTSFFDSEEALQAWRQLFDVLLEDEEGAVLWHCTGGKDRAGLTSVIVLSVLGVDEELILADFALTNEVLEEEIAYVTAEAAKFTSDTSELEQVAALVGVSVDCMRVAFERVRADYGSMLAFAQQQIGLTDEEVATLRERYLE